MTANRVIKLISVGDVEKLLEEAKKELFYNEIKSTKKAGVLSRLKKLEKYIEGSTGKVHYIGNDNCQYITNGFTAIKLVEPLAVEDVNSRNIDLATRFDFGECQKLDVTLGELRAKHKIFKAENKKVNHYESLGVQSYNIAFVLQCCDILGGAISFSETLIKGTKYNMLVVNSENGIAIVLPIRTK